MVTLGYGKYALVVPITIAFVAALSSILLPIILHHGRGCGRVFFTQEELAQ